MKIKTIDKTVYGKLLSDSQPKPILSDEDYDKALSKIENIMSQQSLTLEEETLLQLWVILIEKYEAKYYPI